MTSTIKSVPSVTYDSETIIMPRYGITVLTQPIYFYRGNFRLLVSDRVFLFSAMHLIYSKITSALRQKKRRYGGHYAVTRSLIEGLEHDRLTEYNYNPSSLHSVYPHIHVLADLAALTQAIDLKKRGIIEKLTVGPNLVVFSDEYNGLIADAAIDLVLVPSDWVAEQYICDNPRLENRYKVWPAGINIGDFTPAEIKPATKYVVLYDKSDSKQFCSAVDFILRKYNYVPILIRYGSYTLQEYISALSQATFSVCLSNAESQGIFLVEAWAMNVPTFCFDPAYYHWETPENREVSGIVSSCPYLSDKTGVRWKSLLELEQILQDFQKIKLQFTPREWVLKNMTDNVTTYDFFKKIT